MPQKSLKREMNKAKDKKGNADNTMNIATKLRENDVEFINAMENYLIKLQTEQSKSAEAAAKESKEALKRMGVLGKTGNIKKKIVSWE